MTVGSVTERKMRCDPSVSKWNGKSRRKVSAGGGRLVAGDWWLVAGGWRLATANVKGGCEGRM